MSNGFIDSNKTSRGYPWRVFWLLLFAAVAGVGAAAPMALEVLRPLVQNAERPPLPLPLIIVIGVVQNVALLATVTGVGLLLARKLGRGAPLLESWLYHEAAPASAKGSWKSGLLVGIAVGIAVVVPILIVAPHFPGLPFVSASRVAVWKRVLVCFYGGIDEEILTRLFLLTLVAWLGAKFFQKQKGQVAPVMFWIANIIVAIVFGLGHLPSASLVMRITPEVVVLAVVLNSIAAIPFGYLYWKRGLDAAMIAHFCADFVIYVIGVTFLR